MKKKILDKKSIIITGISILLIIIITLVLINRDWWEISTKKTAEEIIKNETATGIISKEYRDSIWFNPYEKFWKENAEELSKLESKRNTLIWELKNTNPYFDEELTLVNKLFAKWRAKDAEAKLKELEKFYTNDIITIDNRIKEIISEIEEKNKEIEKNIWNIESIWDLNNENDIIDELIIENIEIDNLEATWESKEAKLLRLYNELFKTELEFEKLALRADALLSEWKTTERDEVLKEIRDVYFTEEMIELQKDLWLYKEY